MLALRLSVLLLSIAALAASFAPARAAGHVHAHARAQDDAQTIVCPRCEGSGRVEEPCWICSGGGRHACVGCRELLRWPIVLDSWPFPAEGAAPLGQLFYIPPPGVPGREHVRIERGERPCPAFCIGGELLVGREWVDCKMCRGGKFPCDACKGGMVPCEHCAGDGRAVDACSDCAGAGRIPARPPRDPAICPWCAGAKERPCGRCDAAGHAELGCPMCLDAKRTLCASCRGLGRAPCSACRGTGKDDRRACAGCEGKGALPCRSCAHGWVTCRPCVDGTPKALCSFCHGMKVAKCPGCDSDRYVAWERNAARHVAAGDAALAAEWYAEAALLCERRYERGLRALEKAGRDDLARALKKEGEQELKRLRDLRKQAERAAAAAARKGAKEEDGAGSRAEDLGVRIGCAPEGAARAGA